MPSLLFTAAWITTAWRGGGNLTFDPSREFGKSRVLSRAKKKRIVDCDSGVHVPIYFVAFVRFRSNFLAASNPVKFRSQRLASLSDHLKRNSRSRSSHKLLACWLVLSMNQFVARVANWLANEVIVKSLVRNKGFQVSVSAIRLRPFPNVKQHCQFSPPHPSPFLLLPHHHHLQTSSLLFSSLVKNMAMRTHLRVEKTKEIAKEAMEEAADVVEKEVLKASTSQAGKKEASALKPPPRGGFGGFLEAFAKEVKKDLG